MAYDLLAISSNEKWLEDLRQCAASAGYSLEALKTGSQGLNRILNRRPDLALLDLNLADLEGLAWLKMLRQTEAGRELPVIAASERRTDDEAAAAFSCGADDYVLKTCDPAELVARIRVVLRRRFEREETAGAAMLLGEILLDPGRHQCRVRDRAVELQPRQFELLEILMRKAGRVLSRRYLLEIIWGMSREAQTRTVDVAVGRLRRALGLRAGRWVETVERYGYRFRNPEETLR